MSGRRARRGRCGRPFSGLAILLLLASRAVAAPSAPGQDCLADWRPLGDLRRCEDGDPRCDASDGPGCVFLVDLCFAEETPECTAPPIERLLALTPADDATDRANRRAVVQALAALGGRPTASAVTFAPSLGSAACSEPIPLRIPLRRKAGRPIPGLRSIAAVTLAGRLRDVDRLVLTCLPPVGESAQPLSTGCTAELDEQACAAAEGDWGRWGFLGTFSCLCRAEDAGQPCTRKRHCQGLCLASGPDETQGRCSEHVTEYGCFQVVDQTPFHPPQHVCFD